MTPSFHIYDLLEPGSDQITLSFFPVFHDHQPAALIPYCIVVSKGSGKEKDVLDSFTVWEAEDLKTCDL